MESLAELKSHLQLFIDPSTNKLKRPFNQILSSKSHEEDLKDLRLSILHHTSWMTQNETWSIRARCVLDNIVEYPKCVICGQLMYFKFPNNLNRKLCSNECSTVFYRRQSSGSFESRYGKEKADKIKQTIRERTSNIQPDYEGKRAHEGCVHSEDSKKKMSEIRKNLYRDPVIGKRLRRQHSVTMKEYFSKMTEDDKREFIKRTTLSIKNLGGGHFGKKGFVSPWWDESKWQKFDSTYELAYFKILNDEKVYWKRNHTILIQYLHPILKEFKYYIPDVLIYEDASFKNLIEIVEVKPYHFVNGDPDTSDYIKIVKAKTDSLTTYCYNNGIGFSIVTEKDIEMKGVNIYEYYGWYKENYPEKVKQD